MVAYSFQKRFIAPIRAGTKRQTIRAERGGKSRHARPGDALQLYFAMRTKHCRRIAVAQCEEVWPIRIDLEAMDFGGTAVWIGGPDEEIHSVPAASDLDAFAVSDGFADWEDMQAFWRREHPGVLVFSGVLIRWAPIEAFDPPGMRRGGQIDLFPEVSL